MTSAMNVDTGIVGIAPVDIAPVDAELVDKAYVSLRSRMSRFEATLPSIWKSLDGFRAGNGVKAELRWPSWCLIPAAVTAPLVEAHLQITAYRNAASNPASWCTQFNSDDPPDRTTMFNVLRDDVEGNVDTAMNGPDVGPRMMSELAALYTWRAGQGVYVFDPALVEALTKTRFDDHIPSDAFMHLPEYAVYVLIQRRDAPPFAMMVWLNYDMAQRQAKLHLATDLLDGSPAEIPFTLYLGTNSINEALTQLHDRVQHELRERGMEDCVTPEQRADFLNSDAEYLRALLPFVLYLCSAQPDIQHASGTPDQLPERARPTRTRRFGERMFPPPQPVHWNVGWRLGTALRAQTGERVTGPGPVMTAPRAHLRRAHWHLYWVGQGSRSDTTKREARVRWIPPTLIAASTADDLVGVAHSPRNAVRHHTVGAEESTPVTSTRP